MSENKRFFFQILCEKLKKARLLPKYPMHSAAWELHDEVCKQNPKPWKILYDLKNLLLASPLAASDKILQNCMRDLEECLD